MRSVDVSVFPLSEDMLQGISEDQRAMFAAVSLACMEVETFRKFLNTGPTRSDCDFEIAYVFSQFIVLRLVALKLLEIFKTLRLTGKYNRSCDERLNDFSDRIVQPEFEMIKKHDGFNFVMALRDKTGFHYDLMRFKEAVRLENSGEFDIIQSKQPSIVWNPYGANFTC